MTTVFFYQYQISNCTLSTGTFGLKYAPKFTNSKSNKFTLKKQWFLIICNNNITENLFIFLLRIARFSKYNVK